MEDYLMDNNSSECKYRGGRGPIPPRLWLTVTAMIILSIAVTVYFVRKGWMRFELVTAEMLQTSHRVPSAVLGAYRMFVAFYVFAIIMFAWHSGEEHNRIGFDLRFFTAWNYTTVLVIFILLSFQHIFTYMPRWVSCLTWSLFQIELCNAIFLDIVFWTILFPLGESTKMPKFFVTCNVHAVNLVWLLGEVHLGKLQMVPAHVALASCYTCAYVVFTWIRYDAFSACMPYPFMAATPSDSPVVYVVMSVAMIMMYFVAWLMVQLREKAATGKPVFAQPFSAERSGYAPIA